MATPEPPVKSPYFAAVDLGSNSFHLLIARMSEGKMEIIDREKDMVQIARGVCEDGHLTMASQTRALDCLKRFAERLRDIPREQIRAVGTKTLRTSKAKSFIKSVEKALGVPVQIISGYEEARLVYTGLSHSVINDHNHRLVVDIGGGSTELIIGIDHEPIQLESLNLGCVTFSDRFVKNSGISRSALKKIHLSSCTEIEIIRKNFLKTGWQIAYGTSGTVRAIADLVSARDGGAVIRRSSLDWLAREILHNRSILAAVPALRRTVLPAGIGILQAIFEQLKIETMHVADAALKEGLLYDSIGRLRNEDSRTDTVLKLQQQYKVDADQAQRVAATARYLWSQIEGPVLPGVSRTKVLTWAAQLHEIGLSISHSNHHHHGYYILRYSDLAGFGRYEQYILANLVRSYRKSLLQEKFENMDEVAMAAFVPLLVCLRLAALLHRRREDIEALPTLSFSGSSYKLRFAKHWLMEHPLTLAGLEQEQDYYDKIGVELGFK
ncbi:MAG: Ppx/GppA phosphatase family protein [Pseudomonadales bacterium]|nr:Ppx/GppA phosphatase family protein [Pseudomonadales bacterium]